jgi:Domain of unknown function (DUF151)
MAARSRSWLTVEYQGQWHGNGTAITRPGWLAARLVAGCRVGEDGLGAPKRRAVMAVVADIGFVEMRLDKVVGLTTAEHEPYACIVLEGVSEDHQHLPIQIGPTEASNLSATLTGMEFAHPMSRSLPQACCTLWAAGSGRCGSTG